VRVCLITREFPPVTSYTGGIGRQFRWLAAGLRALGHEVVVLIVGLPRQVQREMDGVSVRGVGHLLTAGPESLAGLGSSLAVRRAVPREGPFDVIYAPEWQGDAALLARSGRSTPLVTNLQTPGAIVRAITPDARRLGRLRPHRVIQARRERTQAEGSQAIVAASRAVLDRTREIWDIGDLPTTVLPNCVDVEMVRWAARGEPPSDFPRDDPVVAFCGRLEGRKGVQVLIAAMRVVWQSHPEARLVLLGPDGAWRGGSMASHVREEAGPFRERIHHLGSQPPELLYPSFAHADVVALPSLWENFPLSALEAMAIGCPLVATGGSGYDDFVRSGSNGLLVRPGDEVELAEAILGLLQDPARRKELGTEAARSIEQYDIGPVCKRHADYLEVVTTAGVRRDGLAEAGSGPT